MTGTPITNQIINRPSLLKWWLTLLVMSVATASSWDWFELFKKCFRNDSSDRFWPRAVLSRTRPERPEAAKDAGGRPHFGDVIRTEGQLAFAIHVAFSPGDVSAAPHNKLWEKPPIFQPNIDGVKIHLELAADAVDEASWYLNP